MLVKKETIIIRAKQREAILHTIKVYHKYTDINISIASANIHLPLPILGIVVINTMFARCIKYISIAWVKQAIIINKLMHRPYILTIVI